MGCNLCTLQKREEHYKLLYEIAQVNGRDFSKAGRDEAAAVDALRRDALRRDPIVVQVLRRTPAGGAASAVTRNRGDGAVDVCTQTDITFEHIMALAKLRAATPPVPDICPFLLSDSCHSIHTMEHEYYECPEYLSNTPAEAERTEEYEYEEVELCRQNSLEKLGLTLCYRTDDEEDTAIYVSQVEPNSIAARDGRIKEGDRILQINGFEVQDREKAVALLASEDARSILFLVTRPDMQFQQEEEEEWLEEEQGENLQELKMQILEREDSTTREEEHLGDDEVTTDTATYSSTTQDKDSGLGRSTESPDHHHPSLLSRLQRRTTAQCLRDRWRAEQSQRRALSPRTAAPKVPSREGKLVMRGSLGGGVGGGGGGGGGVGLLGTENRFQQLLELKCQIRNGGECGVYSIRHSIECSLTEQAGDEGGDGGGGIGGLGGGGAEEEEEEEEGGMEQELRMLNEELRSIELECQSIMQAHHLRQSVAGPDPRAPPLPPPPPPLSPRDLLKRHGRLADIHEHPEAGILCLLGDKDSSSAYNTADSARSTPLGTEGSPDLSLQRRVRLTNQKNLRLACTRSPPLSIPKALKPSVASQQQQPRPQPPPRCDQGLVISSSPDQSNPSPSEGSDPALPADDERCEKKGRTRGGVHRGLPYASPNHYQSSPLQSQAGSRQLQSYMQLLQQHSALGSYSQSQLSLLSLCREPAHNRHGGGGGGSGGGGPCPGEPRMEWKVKVRADGSRYVARRPARDRILRERALRIREERSGGMTTDDDALSEMKLGRYWSKEERKQQVARAREQRKRREHMQRSRLECLREGPGSGAEGRKEVSILELSHRKMMKKRNKKILDNWMTIQELMSHGARAPPEGANNKQVHNAFLSVTTV